MVEEYFLVLRTTAVKHTGVGIMEFGIYATKSCEDWPRGHISRHKVTRDAYFLFSSSERWMCEYRYWALNVCQPLCQEFYILPFAESPDLMRQLFNPIVMRRSSSSESLSLLHNVTLSGLKSSLFDPKSTVVCHMEVIDTKDRKRREGK